jgi:hypothetical protein
MPLLAGLLVTLFSGLAQFLVQYLTKKTAVAVAAIAVLSTVTVGMFFALRATFSSLTGSLTGNALVGFSMAVPPVAGTCLTAISAIWAACTLFAWQRRALDLFVKA